MRRNMMLPATIFMCSCLAGCIDPSEEFGKVYYLDGAGNWGFGVAGVPAGLEAAGYEGDVEVFLWTSSFLPMIDQINVAGNKLRSGELTDRIENYKNRQPEGAVNIIALSAGTGVAVWALEQLPANVMIDNLVLLASSLSYDYDMEEALKRVRGRVYVFYSRRDQVLAVGALGTVDGTFKASAGTKGLRSQGHGKILNFPWSQSYRRYGWDGSHTGVTSENFVKHVIAPMILRTDARRTSRRPGVAVR